MEALDATKGFRDQDEHKVEALVTEVSRSFQSEIPSRGSDRTS